MIVPVEAESDVEGLLEKLSSDLQCGRLTKLARLPQPKIGVRYRDLLRNLYRSSGTAQATIWLEMEDGAKRIYIFLIKADVKGPVSSLLEAPAMVSGYMLDLKGDNIEYVKYSPRGYPSAAELFQRIENMASLYRLSEDRLLKEKALEDYYEWLL